MSHARASSWIFMATLGLWCASAARAQLVTVGAEAGVLVSDARSFELSGGEREADALAGYQVGVPIEVGLASGFGFATGIHFVRDGYRLEYRDSLGLGETVTYRYGSLEVPLLVKAGYGWDDFSLAGVAGLAYRRVLTLRGEWTDRLAPGGVTLPGEEADLPVGGSPVGVPPDRLFLHVGAQGAFPTDFGKVYLDLRWRRQLVDAFGDYRARERLSSVSLGLGVAYLLGG